MHTQLQCLEHKILPHHTPWTFTNLKWKVFQLIKFECNKGVSFIHNFRIKVGLGMCWKKMVWERHEHIYKTIDDNCYVNSNQKKAKSLNSRKETIPFQTKPFMFSIFPSYKKWSWLSRSSLIALYHIKDHMKEKINRYNIILSFLPRLWKWHCT
jgi:hypothetical protein